MKPWPWRRSDAGVALGTGYPGTPSTEILEHFHALGGHAQWAPNEKVAFEVALGAAFGGAAAMVTMKHVGLNVAADPLFTAAYSGVAGALVVVSADDPGMASSQNEQDNRRYAVAAAVPMFEPADSQEAYDFTLAALELSARWKLPVLLRMTTRVCHSKTLVKLRLRCRTSRRAQCSRDAPNAAPQMGPSLFRCAPFRAGHPRPGDDSGPRPARPSSPAPQAGRNRRLERDLPLQPPDCGRGERGERRGERSRNPKSEIRSPNLQSPIPNP